MGKTRSRPSFIITWKLALFYSGRQGSIPFPFSFLTIRRRVPPLRCRQSWRAQKGRIYRFRQTRGWREEENIMLTNKPTTATKQPTELVSKIINGGCRTNTVWINVAGVCILPIALCALERHRHGIRALCKEIIDTWMLLLLHTSVSVSRVPECRRAKQRPSNKRHSSLSLLASADMYSTDCMYIQSAYHTHIDHKA